MENESRHITSRLKDQCLFEKRLSGLREFRLRGRFAEKIAPKFVTARVGDHKADDNATHAMTYKDDRPVMRKSSV